MCGGPRVEADWTVGRRRQYLSYNVYTSAEPPPDILSVPAILKGREDEQRSRN